LTNRNWTRNEALACFNLYCRLPFGKMHSKTPEIIAFAKAIGRTPGAVAMKLVNFASFDPIHTNRNVRGLTNASGLDRDIWGEFEASPNTIAEESEEAFGYLSAPSNEAVAEELRLPSGPTEAEMTRPMRLVQSFFRRSVLASYGYRCCFCRLSIQALLNASHIIPWNLSEERRADPRNGLCLCVLHDRAFDRGLVTVDTQYRIVISAKLSGRNTVPMHEAAFDALAGKPMQIPQRFVPAKSALTFHRLKIFCEPQTFEL
jgi:predicted restriction endonuclease